MEQLNSLQIPWASVLARPNVGVSHCLSFAPQNVLVQVSAKDLMLRSCSLQLQLRQRKKCFTSKQSR